MNAKIIKTETDYEQALARIQELMADDPESSTQAGEELELLSLLVGHYEDQHYPMDAPSPLAAIQFRMEQEQLRAKDLVPYLGSAARVSEVLSGKRTLSINMIRNLIQGLGMSAEVLLQVPKAHPPKNKLSPRAPAAALPA